MKNTAALICFCIASLAPIPAAPAEEPDWARVESLLRDGKAAEAHALLGPYEFDQSGNTRFDYLLGIALLDSGKPDLATLALERVLAVDPDFDGARLEMARAYFRLGDHDRARREFRILLARNPRPAARVTIEKYLQRIDRGVQSRDVSRSAYVEAALGHDSNVNSATSQTQIYVPSVFPFVFNLDPANVESASAYRTLGAGVALSRRIRDGVAVYAAGDVKDRLHRSEHAFDSFSLDVRAGVVLGEKSDVLKLGVMAGDFTLNRRPNRQNVGASAEWSHPLGTADRASVFGMVNDYRFNAGFDPITDISANDFDQSMLGAGWLHVAPSGGKLFVSIFGGAETGAERRADGDKRFEGVRLGAQYPVSAQIDVHANMGGQQGSYEKQNALFLAMRKDYVYDLTLGMMWRFTPDWLLRPQLAFSRNDSNISIYDYSRTDFAVALRREFK
jgi:tetratricopeptide (TPR) repeat protein